MLPECKPSGSRTVVQKVPDFEDCGEVSIPMSMAFLSMTPMTVYSNTDALAMLDVRQVRCSIPLTRYWRPQLGGNFKSQSLELFFVIEHGVKHEHSGPCLDHSH